MIHACKLVHCSQAIMLTLQTACNINLLQHGGYGYSLSHWEPVAGVSRYMGWGRGSLVQNFRLRLLLTFNTMRITYKPRMGSVVFVDLKVLFFQSCWKYCACRILRFHHLFYDHILWYNICCSTSHLGLSPYSFR